MKLDNRLATIASLVKRDAVLVDIGCDHGLLDIYLIKNKLIKKAYASDVNQGPLDNVKTNIKRYDVENIECCLSDGLTNFKNIAFDTVVIAGMGGSLIVDILEANLDLVKGKQLILQPNINSYGLRKFLIENNFALIDDLLVEDNDIIYEIIVVDGISKQDYLSLELEYGYYNLQRNEKLLHIKMKTDLQKNIQILKNIPEGNEKRIAINNKILRIEDYLNENK